jgi:hypothetical protein
MALSVQLALVCDGVDVDAAELTRVASALSKQVNRDFRPIWGVEATVDAFLDLEDVPTDAWPVVIMRNVQGAAGFHDDENGQPFAVVEFGEEWSLTASHEVLEMLADPFGRRLRSANLLEQARKLGLPKRRVRYLVEVCDPSEDSRFGYQVNGVLVSDFYTPQFFDPVTSTGIRYSFTGAIKAPRTVLDGGYISWQDPVNRHWYQVRMFPDELSSKMPHVVDLTKDTAFEKLRAGRSIRSAIDIITRTAQRLQKVTRPMMAAAVAARGESEEGQRARAEQLRGQIRRLMQSGPAETGGATESRERPTGGEGGTAEPPARRGGRAGGGGARRRK